MCGICGFISKNNITLNDLTRMNDTMYHRGPNDSGQEIYVMKGGYNIGLAQRRLSILDLSPAGHQPMHSPDRRVSLVYNGEIYNFQELRQELRTEYNFKSDCDTEVIIAAYLKWGIKCIRRFNGMFAIALYDRENEKLYLVRDRIGKKPLYYSIQKDNFYFGSELKPIMACPGFEREVNNSIVPRFLCQQYINAPESILKDTYKLEPGCILTYQAGKIDIEKYWDLTEVYHTSAQNPVEKYEEAKEGLKYLLKEATKRRMIADVPLGTFLSGGYDSTVITSLAQEISKEPVKTFCIGFNEESYNEAPYAKAISEYLGTEHTEYFINEDEMFKQVKSISKYYDEPFADPSEIPTMLVSALAKTKVTVALSGDGGDEFFCGYNVYQMVEQARKLDLIGGMMHGVMDTKVGRMLELESHMPIKVRAITSNRDTEAKTQFANDNYKRTARQMVLAGEYKDIEYRFESKYEAKNWQVRRMLLDMETYLPGDILAKVDRASMKYSLECRCPILDPEIMEYSFRIPHKFKYMNGDKKHILKDIAYDYVPVELLERPKKGFGVPLDKWMRGPLKAQLLDYSNLGYLTRQGIFEPENTRTFIRNYLDMGDQGAGTGANYSKICWSFLQFQEWYHLYME